MCAVALAGCADVKTPVEANTPTLTARDPAALHPETGDPRDAIDPRTISDRLETLYGGRFAKVSIPADPFSQFSDAVHPDIACPPGPWNGAR